MKSTGLRMRESGTPLPPACSTHCAPELGSKDPLNVSSQLNNQPSGRPVTSPDGLISIQRILKDHLLLGALE